MDSDTSCGAVNIASSVRQIRYDVIGSTNAEALARASAGDPGPLWITARAQTAGRGRRGRAWTSPSGNLYATLLLSDPGPAAEAPQLSFVAALAVHDAVLAAAGPRPLSLMLKWPNDVLCNGAKLAGILIEGEGRPLNVAIGIGINCRQHPADTAYPATDLRDAGVDVGPEQLFDQLAPAMGRRLGQWDRGRGFASVRADWLARAHTRGTKLSLRLGERQSVGSFETLDDAGRLILRRPDGNTEAIMAGDVFPIGQPVPATVR
jgi:BirA family transcriptional regulator, biotin operon repressor / biotin---[acetyl-CoA-carboxylase] ligase